MAYVHAGIPAGLENDEKRMAWQGIQGLTERDVGFFIWLHELGFEQHEIEPVNWSPLMRDFRCELTRRWLLEDSGASEALGDWVVARGEFTWRLNQLTSRGLLLPDSRPPAQEERQAWGYVIDHQTYDYWRLLKAAKTGNVQLLGY